MIWKAFWQLEGVRGRFKELCVPVPREIERERYPRLDVVEQATAGKVRAAEKHLRARPVIRDEELRVKKPRARRGVNRERTDTKLHETVEGLTGGNVVSDAEK